MNMPYPGDPILSAAAQKELGTILSKSRAFALAYAHVVPSYIKLCESGRYKNLDAELSAWLGYRDDIYVGVYR